METKEAFKPCGMRWGKAARPMTHHYRTSPREKTARIDFPWDLHENENENMSNMATLSHDEAP